MNYLLQNTIPDRMLIRICMLNTSLPLPVFIQGIKRGDFKKVKDYYSLTRNINGVNYTITLKYSNKAGVIANIYYPLNGNFLYREQFKLADKPYTSIHEKRSNFITEEEVQRKHVTRRDFTLKVLPEVIMGNVDSILVDVRNYINKNFKPIKLPPVTFTDKTFSFQEIEICCDVPISESSDPTVNTSVLDNLNTISRGFSEKDNIGKNDKEIYVAASDTSYSKGNRFINYTLYKDNLLGRAYIKSVEGNLFRNELIFQSEHKGAKTDTISEFGGGKKAFNNEADIKKIFKKLTRYTAEITERLFDNVEVDNKKLKQQLHQILSTDFSPDQCDTLIRELTKYPDARFKVHASHLPRRTLEKVQGLVKEGKLFSSAYNGSGDYVFNKKLLEEKL